MWPQTAATPYLLQPWNSAPLTGSPPEAIAAKQERERRSHSFCRGFVFRVYARLNIFLLIQPPYCRAYTLHIFIVGKESTNLITTLYIETFPPWAGWESFLRKISAFLAIMPLIDSIISSRYQDETPNPYPTMGPEVNVDSRASDGLLW